MKQIDNKAKVISPLTGEAFHSGALMSANAGIF